MQARSAPAPAAGRPSAGALALGAGLAVGAAAAVVVGLVLALVASPLVGALAALVLLGAVAAGVAAWVRRSAGPTVLRLVGGAPPDPTTAEGARLANVTSSVAVSVGLPEPALRVLASPAANALVTGPDARRATLVVTSGLLERADRLALEAVVAHQLALVRAGATDRRDVAVAVARLGAVLPRLGALAVPPADAVAEADLAALSATRYPPGLLRALEAVAAGPDVDADPALGPLWFAPPGARDQLALRLEIAQELT